jgi:hypothetical protein
MLEIAAMADCLLLHTENQIKMFFTGIKGKTYPFLKRCMYNTRFPDFLIATFQQTISGQTHEIIIFKINTHK